MHTEMTLSKLLADLQADLPELLDDVGAGLQKLDESYADFLASGRGEVLSAARLAMEELVQDATECLHGEDVAASMEPDRARDRVAWTLFEQVGRDHCRRDLPMRALLSAYRIGGQVGWRRISAVAVRCGLPADALGALAEAVFRLVDELSAATTAGYVEEQAESAIAREQVRDALVERLLSDRSSSASVEQAARAAGWPLPAEAAVVLLRTGEPGRELLGRLPPGCLVVRHMTLPGVVVPDPDAPGRRRRLVAALQGTTAVVGPTVSLAELPEGARLTEVASQTLEQRPPTQAPVFVVEHLDALIVHRDRRLLEALQEHCLKPLTDAVPASRDALRETLRSWLVQMGNRRAVAEELGVHPQTVRYRLGRLQELFGPSLDDPRVRLQLLLALGWEDRRELPASRLELVPGTGGEDVDPPLRAGGVPTSPRSTISQPARTAGLRGGRG